MPPRLKPFASAAIIVGSGHTETLSTNKPGFRSFEAGNLEFAAE
jgi:hypothetical protein